MLGALWEQCAWHTYFYLHLMCGTNYRQEHGAAQHQDKEFVLRRWE